MGALSSNRNPQPYDGRYNKFSPNTLSPQGYKNGVKSRKETMDDSFMTHHSSDE